MTATFSLEQLASQVNDWCSSHDVSPAHGGAGEQVTERNVRYYRTLGLVDPPLSADGAGYGEKHFLQLIAIRLLQAQGQPLRRIRDLVYGRSIDNLRELQKRGAAEAKASSRLTATAPATLDEVWRAVPLSDDFVLISRTGQTITVTQRDALRAILHPEPARRR